MSANRFRFRVWDIQFKRMKTTGVGCCYGELKGDDSVAIMMSTGLTDKNGKEIFEGDILLEDCPRGNKCVVEWDDLHASFHIAYDEKHCTVIGNIYQDEHLLTEAK